LKLALVSGEINELVLDREESKKIVKSDEQRRRTMLKLQDDYARLMLRLVLGLLMLFHGQAKLVNGIEGIVGLVQGLSLPGFLAYLVFLGEVIAPIFLIVGVWTRVAAFLIAGNLVVAVLLVHTSEFFTRADSGAWALELQAFYFFTACAIMILGAGRYSVGGSHGRWN
jgi:putative oxidoreductase